MASERCRWQNISHYKMTKNDRARNYLSLLYGSYGPGRYAICFCWPPSLPCSPCLRSKLSSKGCASSFYIAHVLHPARSSFCLAWLLVCAVLASRTGVPSCTGCHPWPAQLHRSCVHRDPMPFECYAAHISSPQIQPA